MILVGRTGTGFCWLRKHGHDTSVVKTDQKYKSKEHEGPISFMGVNMLVGAVKLVKTHILLKCLPGFWIQAFSDVLEELILGH